MNRNRVTACTLALFLVGAGTLLGQNASSQQTVRFGVHTAPQSNAVTSAVLQSLQGSTPSGVHPEGSTLPDKITVAIIPSEAGSPYDLKYLRPKIERVVNRRQWGRPDNLQKDLIIISQLPLSRSAPAFVAFITVTD
jgi:hypothetical protein